MVWQLLQCASSSHCWRTWSSASTVGRFVVQVRSLRLQPPSITDTISIDPLSHLRCATYQCVENDLLALGLPVSLFQETCIKREFLLHQLTRVIDRQLISLWAMIDFAHDTGELLRNGLVRGFGRRHDGEGWKRGCSNPGLTKQLCGAKMQYLGFMNACCAK